MLSLLLSLELSSSIKVQESHIFFSGDALDLIASRTFEVSAIEETVSHKNKST
jgi:hypothetical protein